jgi:NAD-dependent SIR2 family protein deacetylase
LGFVVGIACVTAATAGEPIKDKDAFEKQSIECIMSGGKDSCWSKLILKHVPPYNEDVDKQDFANTLRKAEALLMSQGSVYKVHPVEKKIVADIAEGRAYVIEYSNGKARGVFIYFRRIKEEWYIISFTVGDENAFFRNIFKFPE